MRKVLVVVFALLFARLFVPILSYADNQIDSAQYPETITVTVESHDAIDKGAVVITKRVPGNLIAPPHTRSTVKENWVKYCQAKATLGDTLYTLNGKICVPLGTFKAKITNNQYIDILVTEPNGHQYSVGFEIVQAEKAKPEGAGQATAQASTAAQDQPVMNASAKSTKPAATQPGVKKDVETINDAFAKASLRALKAIQGDATLPDVTQAGDILFSKQVVDAIDAADSEARTGAETAMSKVLSALHIRHSTNNLEVSTKEEQAKAAHHYKSTSDLAREIETREMLEKDPGIAAFKNSSAFQNETACAAGLESLFRARKSGPIPAECSATQKSNK